MGTIAELPPDFKSQGEQIGLGLTEPAVATRLGKLLLSTAQELLVWVIEFALKNVGRFVVFIAKSIMRGEDASDPVFKELTAAAVKDLTGADLNAGHASVGRTLLQSITGGAGAAGDGQLTPSTAGAEAYLEMVMKLALEGYLEGSIVHALSAGYLEKFGELDDILAKVLGIERMSRAAIRPLFDARVVTPFEWHVNKTYRPTRLSPSTVARQWARQRWDWDDVVEELARQGYDDVRIDALINEQRKFLSVADVRQMVTRGEWTGDQARKHLQDQGYDEDAAERALRVEGLNRIERHESAIVSALLTAYVNRNIGRGELVAELNARVGPPAERALALELADARHALNVKQLSPSEARACVKAGILAVPDFRAALRQDGYDEPSVTALELLLRQELDEQTDLDEHRRRAAAERAAEQQQRDEDRAKRKAEIEAERALARRGSLSQLERAVVRGLIPFSRYEELLTPQYDPDTVAVLVDLVEVARQDFLDAERRREEALQRAARRDVAVADLEQAVMVGTLGLLEYRRELERRGFSAPDADLLTATLTARKRDVDAAVAARRQAELAARSKSIDLGRFEALVRRGARTLPQYDQLLTSLGFDDAARAGMRELLQLQIADDTKARQLREQLARERATQGLSLEQFRRAVIQGIKTVDDFQTFLVAERYTTDAQAVLVAELRVDVEEAEAARARRAAATAPPGARVLPLSTLARAARLGLLSVDGYRSRLVAMGYTDDDVELELALLVTEIADVQARRQIREDVGAGATPRGLSLAQLATAVKAGAATLDEYQARAIALGYDQAAVQILSAVLEDELAAQRDAERRHAEIDVELQTRNLSLGTLDAGVKAGLVTLADYRATVLSYGYAADDVALLEALLLIKLEATGG